ncbi:MAG: asparaginase [Clostridia bacterium]|nr:asparaginase [Clostridia bacterium]
MKILFMFTGGTIGCTAHGDVIGIDGKKPYLLLERYREIYGMDFDYTTETPYLALSESNTGDTIRLLCESVRAQLSAGYDGIVVTHGTDTLQYSAAALAYTLADAEIPVLLVSSNQPIESPTANGLANLHGAIRFIREVGRSGVFVSYQNKGEALKIHRGARLLASPAFSDGVYSIFDSFFGHFPAEGAFCENPDYRALPDAGGTLSAAHFTATCDGICRLFAYPGNPYSALPAGVRYLLHESYHSGTINTAEQGAEEFFKAAKAKGVKVFLTGVAEGATYESTRVFEELGIEPIFGLAPIAAFVKLWLLTAENPQATVTAEMLQASLAADVVP